jgi:hypothetical protein
MHPSQKKASAKRGAAVRDITVKRIKQDDEDFRVHHIHDEPEDLASVEPLITTSALRNEVESVEEDVDDALESMAGPDLKIEPLGEREPKDVVKVKFGKFVQLVTSRDCADVVGENPDEDVVISSNLLTELAGAHDEREEKKIPLVFLVGLAIGVVLTYILIMK